MNQGTARRGPSTAETRDGASRLRFSAAGQVRSALARLLALVTFVGCASMAGPALAQGEAEKRQQAKEHYERATRLYDVGKFGEAIGEYEQAYLLVEDPALLFNIGQAYRLWDRPEEAIRSYKNYLRRRPDAPNRADVEKKIDDLERVVEDRRRAGAAPPPAAQPPLPVLPAPGPATAVPPAPYPSGPASADALAPPPVSVPVPGPALTVEGGQQPSPSRTAWVPYALLGTSGVCLLTSMIAGAVGASKAKKLEDASKNRDVFDPAVESSGKTANGVAFVAAVGAVVTGGIGGYLFWRARRSADATTVSAAVTPTFAGASARVSF